MIELKIINRNEDKKSELYSSYDCQQVIDSMNELYDKIGFNPPWVGYFVIKNNEVEGTGGFTGKPIEGIVEIAYWTFKAFEGLGNSSFTCKELISIAQKTDPDIIITAKTAPEENASTKILRKNGLIFSKIVQDHEIGDAWLWTL